MTDEQTVQRISQFLADKHLKPDNSWIRDQLEALTDTERRDSNNVIYKRILESDWKELSSDVCFSKLPSDLDTKLFNDKRRVFAGNYVLQVSSVRFTSGSLTALLIFSFPSINRSQGLSTSPNRSPMKS